jgi:hypothetical protein
MKTFILFFIAFSTVSVFSQVKKDENSELKEKSYYGKYDYNIAITQGFSYNTGNNNFHYINFDFGYKFFKKHEIGICIGDNDMIWYGGYYRINFEENINIGLKIAKLDSYSTYSILNEFSFGRDLMITSNFYFRTQVFFSIRSKYPLGIKNESHFNKGGFLIGLNYLL